MHETTALADVIEPCSSPAEKAIQSSLLSIDWSFMHRKRAPAIEAIHPYPAKFIGDIPRALLRALPLPENTVVFDPFVGSGTTLLEAQRHGVPSVGVDLNPIACLIARVKTAPTPTTLPEIARKITLAASENRQPLRWYIPNVDHWFKADVQTAVAALLQEINALRRSRPYDALRVALSSILVRVSKQDSDTRYAAIEKSVTKPDVSWGGVRTLAERLIGWQSRRFLNPETLAQLVDDVTHAADVLPTDIRRHPERLTQCGRGCFVERGNEVFFPDDDMFQTAGAF